MKTGERHDEPHRKILTTPKTMRVYHNTQLRTYSLDWWVQLVVSGGGGPSKSGKPLEPLMMAALSYPAVSKRR